MNNSSEAKRSDFRAILAQRLLVQPASQDPPFGIVFRPGRRHRAVSANGYWSMRGTAIEWVPPIKLPCTYSASISPPPIVGLIPCDTRIVALTVGHRQPESELCRLLGTRTSTHPFSPYFNYFAFVFALVRRSQLLFETITTD